MAPPERRPRTDRGARGAGGRPAGGRSAASRGGKSSESPARGRSGGAGSAKPADRSRTTGRSGAPERGGGAGRATPKRRDTDPPPITRWVDYPSPKYRSSEAPPEPEPARRPALRVKRGDPAPNKTRAERPGRPTAREHPARRRRRRQTEALDELGRLAGSKRTRALDQLGRAAALFAAGRDRDALRAVRPLATAYPDAAGVQELLGLCHYRVGQFPAARAALERFVELTDSTEQHPVLMDCHRAAGKHRRVETLWAELAQASPSSALVIEGRIVMAGSLADRGRLAEAIALLEKRSSAPKRVEDHHLRLWYALGDLHDRAANAPAARRWFEAVARRDRAFADVAERLAALGRRA